MSDSFREVTHTSWFSRIGRSVGGVIFGLILILVMIIGLFWNEGRAVQTAQSLAEGAGAVVAVAADKVDAANEGKLVHVSGPVTTGDTLSDPDFAMSSEGVRLVRTVEMYQWKEDKKTETTTKVGGGEETVTTYSYSRGWDDEPNDSGSFKQPDGHLNPPMEIRGRSTQVEDGKLVAFDLDRPVLDLIGGGKKLAVEQGRLNDIDAAYPGTRRVSVVDGNIYLGFNPTTPAIGDYRISYEVVPLGVISVIGQQVGTKFSAYQTQAGDALLMVDNGTVPAEKMFADAVSANTIITWILRVVGIILLAIGFSLLMAPLGVLADVIPFVGSLVRMGTGLIAFLLAIVVGTVTIAVAWFWYRPLLAIGILVVGALIAAAIIYVGRSRGSKQPAAPIAPAAPA